MCRSHLARNNLRLHSQVLTSGRMKLDMSNLANWATTTMELDEYYEVLRPAFLRWGDLYKPLLLH